MQSSERLLAFLTPLVSGKRVGVLGFGREGQSTYRLLRRFFPSLPITVMDKETILTPQVKILTERDRQLDFFLGKDYLSQLGRMDVIFKSPGVSPYLLEIQDVVTRGAIVTSQTDAFFSVFRDQVIAITGTKGKSTASSVLTQVLGGAGKKVSFIGNIGAPAFDALAQIDEESLIVYETSSHQCEGLRVSPHIGVFLNLYQDHLDYYPSLEAYGLAKRSLFVHQQPGDYCLANLGDDRVSALTSGLSSQRLGFAASPMPGAQVFVDTGGFLQAFGESLMPVAEIPLNGQHNQLNVMPAVIVAHLLGISPRELRQRLAAVTPVKGRLEEVGQVRGIRFIDDALATIPEATIAALDACGSQVQTLMVGGYDRGQDFSSLARHIAASSIKTLILFPTTGSQIAELVGQLTDRIAFYPVASMSEAVAVALKTTSQGKTVLLSTASASFGLFHDYRDRSQQLLQALSDKRG